VGFLARRYQGKKLSFIGRLINTLIIIACVAPIVRSVVKLPPSEPIIRTPTPELRVLNWNVLGEIPPSAKLLEDISRIQPDIAILQEVNFELAKLLQTELFTSYPCQILEPAPNAWGMGVIAKRSCSKVPITISGDWVGKPLVAAIDVGKPLPLIVVDIHAIHPHAFLRPNPKSRNRLGLSATIMARESALQSLITELSKVESSGIIMAGDLNATMRNSVYEEIRSTGYIDSWLELHHFTSGGTWPYPGLAGTPVLSGLIRIDYLFHSKALAATSIERLLPSSGSDHAALLATFH
jgi:endonuclease/exonuclease/phosphatase (EEP) superfamily protein YafD